MPTDKAEQAPRPVWLDDYRPFPFRVESVDMQVALDSTCTRITTRLEFIRRDGEDAADLTLDGVGLELEHLALNGKDLDESRYELSDCDLVVHDVPERFNLETVVTLNPADNAGDEGLFDLHGKLATQCEAEGFRKITFYPDRPDVLAPFTTTLIAARSHYPVLLGNGNLEATGDLEDDRHFARWNDPFPKPSYIFALVAGDFGCLSDVFTTGSGRNIELNIYADHDRIEECQFAMGALKRALAWEEEQYGREYDLDIYNIVALTGHTGAMENKGLNIFDANGICADPAISTDQDYQEIERILAHEVFHNWTGNRVTCRDWFQLCLKEGLTRFRDQCFSQDMSDAARKRIDRVRALQRNQFPEDDGPAAHPVRPDHYIQIRNFYTNTVYDKGAELIRMLYCLLGDETFRAGVRAYLDRHDGQAVTVEDFIGVMELTSGRDLSRFCNWYGRAGRPRVVAAGVYDGPGQRYTLTLTQHSPAGKQDIFHIPVLLGLLGPDGEELQVKSDDAARVDGNWLAELTEGTQTFVFDNVSAAPVPSLLRGFSAPVSLDTGLERPALALLWRTDNDTYNRWQSGQTLAIQCIRQQAARWHAGEQLALDPLLSETWSCLLHSRETEPGLLAELLTLPDEPALSEGLEKIDLEGHRAAREYLLTGLVGANRAALLERYHALAPTAPWQFDAAGIGRRALRNTCLELLLAAPDEDSLNLALAQVEAGHSMTDTYAALSALCHIDCRQREQALALFYARWQHNDTAIDKWFAAQALSRMPGALDAILALEQHPDLDIHNAPRAMAFYGGLFRQNRVAFHSGDGRGYDMLADRLIMVDALKPGATYWLMPQLLQWRRFDPARSRKMRAALERIMAADISPALYETVSNALESPPA